MTEFVNVLTGRREDAEPGSMLHRGLVKDEDWTVVGEVDDPVAPVEPAADPESDIRREELENIAREHGVDPDRHEGNEDLLDAIRAAQAGDSHPVGSVDEEGDVVYEDKVGNKRADHDPDDPDNADKAAAAEAEREAQALREAEGEPVDGKTEPADATEVDEAEAKGKAKK